MAQVTAKEIKDEKKDEVVLDTSTAQKIHHGGGSAAGGGVAVFVQSVEFPTDDGSTAPPIRENSRRHAHVHSGGGGGAGGGSGGGPSRRAATTLAAAAAAASGGVGGGGDGDEGEGGESDGEDEAVVAFHSTPQQMQMVEHYANVRDISVGDKYTLYKQLRECSDIRELNTELLRSILLNGHRKFDIEVYEDVAHGLLSIIDETLAQFEHQNTPHNRGTHPARTESKLPVTTSTIPSQPTYAQPQLQPQPQMQNYVAAPPPQQRHQPQQQQQQRPQQQPQPSRPFRQ
jgi:hypothetical protein